MEKEKSETNEMGKVSRFKQKNFWFKVVGIFLLCLVSLGIGNSSAKIDLGDKKVTYDELTKEIDKRKELIQEFNENIESADQNLTELKKNLQSHEEELNKAMEVINNKEKVESEIEKLSEELESKKGELSEIDKDLNAKNDELAAVSSRILKKKKEPKTLSAGTFIVGSDIPASRYSASAASGSGNFIVYDSGGGLKVNQILGSYGVAEHVFFAEEGDQIEITIPVTFTAIE